MRYLILIEDNPDGTVSLNFGESGGPKWYDPPPLRFGDPQPLSSPARYVGNQLRMYAEDLLAPEPREEALALEAREATT